MGKLIKYEIRKDVSTYISVFALLVCVQLYLVVSLVTKSEKHVAISSLLFVLIGIAGIGIVMLIGVVSYTRELGSKYSYMTFMLPRTTKQIVGAKYVTLLIVTIVSTAVYCGFLLIDLKLAESIYKEQFDIARMIDNMIKSVTGKSVTDIALGLLATVIGIWINIIVTVSFGYVAVTLSFSLLSGKKGKIPLSLLFFIIIRVISFILINRLPTFDYGSAFLDIVRGAWPSYLVELILIVCSFFGVAKLLEKKVSL